MDGKQDIRAAIDTLHNLAQRDVTMPPQLRALVLTTSKELLAYLRGGA
jgi:hypothetical protein